MPLLWPFRTPVASGPSRPVHTAHNARQNLKRPRRKRVRAWWSCARSPSSFERLSISPQISARPRLVRLQQAALRPSRMRSRKEAADFSASSRRCSSLGDGIEGRSCPFRSETAASLAPPQRCSGPWTRDSQGKADSQRSDSFVESRASSARNLQDSSSPRSWSFDRRNSDCMRPGRHFVVPCRACGAAQAPPPGCCD